MSAILEARGLNKSFGAVVAAADINVSVERDSVCGLIGSNGAGKTTFVNMITGYMKPDQGEIVLEGPAAELAHDPRVIDTYLGAARATS
jgi:branched-chain amino acid transport system ATP-binding protein